MARRKTKVSTKRKGSPKDDLKDEDFQRDEKRGRHRSKTNDPAWYAMTPELLAAAASLPFSNAVGTSYQFDGTTQFVPGIMTLRVIPCVSIRGDYTSAINIAATASYSFVRHANSGSSNYDSPDLMIYEMAVANIYAYINYLQRVYGTAMLYAHGNRYLPQALIQAMGVDFKSVHESLANFRYGINVLIHKAASLACPANMTYFNREAFMFSGIYSEGDSIKSQLYMYVPAGFMQYSELASGEQGGGLNYVPLSSVYYPQLTVPQLLEYGNQLLQPIIASEDMNIMSGDILKAYGSNGILKLAPMDEFYTVIPTTDLNVLEQIQNSDIFTNFDPGVSPVATPPWKAEVRQQVGTISTGPFINSSVYLPANGEDRDLRLVLLNRAQQQHLLTTILVNPTPADIIERTRNMNIVVEQGSGSSKLYKVFGSSDVVVDCTAWLFYLDPDASHIDLTQYQCSPINMIGGYGDTAETLVMTHCVMENFKFHPKMYYFAFTSAEGADAGDPSNYTYRNMAVDIDNYTLISENEITRMNDMALLSLFTVPSIAKAY